MSAEGVVVRRTESVAERKIVTGSDDSVVTQRAKIKLRIGQARVDVGSTPSIHGALSWRGYPSTARCVLGRGTRWLSLAGCRERLGI